MVQKLSTREKIVHAADDLIYKNGFEFTSFQDISKAVNISRGNFYHHFKTKDEILDAVVEKRLTDTQVMLDEWDVKSTSPLDSVKCFINILITNKEKIIEYGCPVGTLVTELAKLEHHHQSKANKVFVMFKDWIKDHLKKLGINNKKANQMALHILMRSQGIATMYNAFHDEQFLKDEVKLVHNWLEAELR